MRQGRLVATGVMLLFCVLAAWQSWLLPLTDKLGPGPGFFPFWMALIGIALAIGLLVVTLREPVTAPTQAPDGEDGILPSGPGASRWLAIVVSLAVAAAAMDYIGFRITMLVFNAALAIALGERRWWVIALFAVLGSVGVFYVFTTWLDVLLPVGTAFGI